MFNLGTTELIIVFVLVIILFGPKKIPELSKTLGKLFGQLRRASDDFKDEINREIESTKKPMIDSAPETPPKKEGPESYAEYYKKEEKTEVEDK